MRLLAYVCLNQVDLLTDALVVVESCILLLEIIIKLIIFVILIVVFIIRFGLLFAFLLLRSLFRTALPGWMSSRRFISNGRTLSLLPRYVFLRILLLFAAETQHLLLVSRLRLERLLAENTCHPRLLVNY